MAKTLKFEKHAVVVRDNDGDAHDQEVTSAVVDQDTAGQEVFLRDGSARVLRAGDVVVPAGAGKHDVFTAKEWEDTWNDDERVEDHGGALRSQDVADDNEYKDVAPNNEPQVADKNDWDDYLAWKASRNEPTDLAVADDNDDERPQDTVPNAPKDDVTASPKPAKKAATSSGKRS
jgi:hypothetical protein